MFHFTTKEKSAISELISLQSKVLDEASLPEKWIRMAKKQKYQKDAKIGKRVT